MTKWCNNCETHKDSWEDKKHLGYKHHVRCWSCDKWSLVYGSDKNLWDWWCNGIDDSKKAILEKLGVDADSSSKKRYDKSDLWKLYYWARILNSKYVGVSGKVQQMNFFSTEWNNNLLIVIDGEGSYGINLLVYEMPMEATGNPSAGPLERFYISNCSYFSDARDKIKQLEKTLKGDNPIFYRDYVTVDYDNKNYDSSSYPMTFKGGVVERIKLPSDAKYNPDKYIKPLDIVLEVNRKMVHSCIYLGDKNVCHVIAPNRNAVVKMDSWSNFLSVISADKILRYHPVIAFKDPNIIIKHVAKSVEGTSNYFVPGVKNSDGSFSLWKSSSERSSNNCENFTNACVFGLNFSELAARDIGSSNTTFNVSSRINETNGELNKLSYGDSVDSRINDIKSYKKRGNENRIARDIDREGIEMQNCIEVQPKDYKIDSSTTELANLLSKLFI